MVRGIGQSQIQGKGITHFVLAQDIDQGQKVDCGSHIFCIELVKAPGLLQNPI